MHWCGWWNGFGKHTRNRAVKLEDTFIKLLYHVNCVLFHHFFAKSVFPCFDAPDYKLVAWPPFHFHKDVTNEPTRDDIEQALQEGAKPDAEIDDPDEIPESSGRKRKVEAGESNDSQTSKKQKRNDDSSSSSSSSSSGNAKGAKEEKKPDKSFVEAVPKSKTSASAKATGRGRGRGGAKLLDTSGVVPHIRPEIFQASIDRGGLENRTKDKPASSASKRSKK